MKGITAENSSPMSSFALRSQAFPAGISFFVEIEGVLKKALLLNKKNVTKFSTQRPAFADDNLLAQLQAKNVIVTARPLVTDSPLWVSLLVNFGPTLLIVGLVVMGTRSMRKAGGLGGIGGIGKSKAIRGDDLGTKRVTFDDGRGGSVGLQAAHWPQPCLQPAVVAFDDHSLTRGVCLNQASPCRATRPNVTIPTSHFLQLRPRRQSAPTRRK